MNTHDKPNPKESESKEMTTVDLFLETGHSLLGPSSAKRWLTCTPSARLGEAIPDPGSSSPYALEGTAAHTFAEIRLNYKLGKTPFAEYAVRVSQAKLDHAPHIGDWSKADWDAIDEYVQYCIDEVERLGGNYLTGGSVVWEAERTVDFSEYVPMGKGTADFTIYAPEHKTIKAIDLKFGKGIAVDARENDQARLYALGMALGSGPGSHDRVVGNERDWPAWTVEWAISQPRLNYLGEDSCDLGWLIYWAEDYVKPRAEAAWAGEGDLSPSAEACFYCKVAPTCRARFEQNRDLALAEFGVEFVEETTTAKAKGSLPVTKIVGKVTKDASTLSPDELGELLPKLDGWLKWVASVQQRALEVVRDEGVEIPGYKLVRGRSNRGWDTSVEGYDTQIVETLLAAGFPETQIMTPPKGPELKSVAQIEKAVGLRRFPELVGALVVKPLGTPALVQEWDPREALTAELRSEEVLAQFGEISTDSTDSNKGESNG